MKKMISRTMPQLINNTVLLHAAGVLALCCYCLIHKATLQTFMHFQCWIRY